MHSTAPATQPPVGVPWHQATFVAAFPRFWRGYTTFRGRAARPEFWWWTLWWFIITQVAQIPWIIGLVTWRPPAPSASDIAVLDDAFQSYNPFPVWGFLLSSLPPIAAIGLALYAAVTLAAALPWIALALRRLHDSNRSGWWVLLFLVPFGNVVLIVLLAMPSDERGTRFDPQRSVRADD
ncbi:hypothetical protein DEJ23_14775 [Curtobacterium sp. MCSS17_008]|uniref:DUF805 domain-containing protein n=1 Tax=Curtobacterium sp. MCSS17_008 TaxID=2175647 RepID=UPI000DA6DF3C|nr:DUF805 domain-containing protein [Curtobacterium sp. MCSS17_008]PZF53339.1 hypothetical protein DEJ23_14775 [Curtobacterium sp. MCSS17_008]